MLSYGDSIMENGTSANLVHLPKKKKKDNNMITSSIDQSHDRWWRSIFMGSTGNNYDINKQH